MRFCLYLTLFSPSVPPTENTVCTWSSVAASLQRHKSADKTSHPFSYRRPRADKRSKISHRSSPCASSLCFSFLLPRCLLIIKSSAASVRTSSSVCRGELSRRQTCREGATHRVGVGGLWVQINGIIWEVSLLIATKLSQELPPRRGVTSFCAKLAPSAECVKPRSKALFFKHLFYC